MAKFLKPDPGTLPHLRWRSSQQLVTVETSSDGRTTNGQYLHVAGVTRPSLQPKLKADENDHALKVTPGIVSCFVDVFCTFCQKRQLLSVSQHSISI